MHHFVTEMCTCVHIYMCIFLLQIGALCDISLMHFGICETSHIYDYVIMLNKK